MFKRVTISLLGISVIVMLVTEAAAGGIGGTAFTKGVECDITAFGVGNVKKDPKSVGCDIFPTDTSQTITGLAVCENIGGNKPPGLELAEFSGSFGDLAPINPADVDKNGKAFKVVVANLDTDELAALKSACPSDNFTVTDFVPCGPFKITFDLRDETTGDVLATETLSCQLQPCTLGFDKKTGLPERKQYTCNPVP